MNCALCGLNYDDKELNFHHLIPKSYHNNKRILNKHTIHELNSTGIYLCYGCHNKIHSCIDEKDLAFEFNTLDKLKEIEDIKNWIVWKQKHPNFNSTYNRMTNKRRGK